MTASAVIRDRTTNTTCRNRHSRPPSPPTVCAGKATVRRDAADPSGGQYCLTCAPPDLPRSRIFPIVWLLCMGKWWLLTCTHGMTRYARQSCTGCKTAGRATLSPRRGSAAPCSPAGERAVSNHCWSSWPSVSRSSMAGCSPPGPLMPSVDVVAADPSPRGVRVGPPL
jgi:hypothetical protein